MRGIGGTLSMHVHTASPADEEPRRGRTMMERNAGSIVLPAVFHERLKRSARTAKEDLEHENDAVDNC